MTHPLNHIPFSFFSFLIQKHDNLKRYKSSEDILDIQKVLKFKSKTERILREFIKLKSRRTNKNWISRLDNFPSSIKDTHTEFRLIKCL